MRATSLEAWARIQDGLPSSRAKVLRVIMEHPGLTGREIERALSDQKAGRKANARISELTQQGLIQAIGERGCSVTGHSATIWAWTGSTSAAPLPKKEKMKDVLTQLSERIQRLEARLGAQQ